MTVSDDSISLSFTELTTLIQAAQRAEPSIIKKASGLDYLKLDFVSEKQASSTTSHRRFEITLIVSPLEFSCGWVLPIRDVTERVENLPLKEIS